MADRLNAGEASTLKLPWLIKVSREGTSITIEFNPHLEDDAGYLPGRYSGRVLDGRVIEATFDPLGHEHFVDPFAQFYQQPMCYSSWDWIDGRLDATIGDDGRSIAGTVLDTFRDLGTQDVFTVKTSFRTLP